MKHIVVLGLLAWGMVACGPEVSLENRPCPCTTGWTCETARSICVRDGEVDPEADAGAVAEGSDGRSGQSPGGQAWMPAELLVGAATIEAVRFGDDQHGFLAGSEGALPGVFATVDGGAIWSIRQLDVAPYGVGASPSLTTVLAAGNGTRPLWSSSDRGASFVPVSWTLDGWPASVRFLDEQNVLMGDEVADRVFRSSDAGQTWSVHVFGRDVLPGTRAIESLGSRHAWIVGGPAFRGDGTGATVAYSSDAAQTWTIATLTDRAHSRIGGALHGIAVVSATEVWVAGENRQVFHTTDGMRTWTQLQGIPADILHFGGIAVRGNTIVIAGSIGTSDYGLYRSIDGGDTFQIIGRRSRGGWDANGIHGVTQTSQGALFVYGDAGLLWKYSGVMLGLP